MPNVRATVVTLRTTVEPGNRTVTHTIAIADGRARSSDELDSWRLYDLKRNEVTFVDDVDRTRETLPLAQLLERRRAATAGPLDANIPRATIAPTGKSQSLLGLQAAQTVIRLRGYERELWIAQHPQIPAQLFAVMHVSSPPSSPFAPVTRDVDARLAAVRGFPLLDRSKLAYGDKKMVVERTVVSVAQQDVPRATFDVPAGYKDMTPRPVAAKKKAK